MNLKEHFYFIF